MGCDIHMVLERKWDDKWVGLKEVDRPASGRNYSLFTELAGVRGTSDTALPARGVPADASDLAALMYDDWDGDAHTPSYVSMDEFLSAYIRTTTPEKKAQWVGDLHAYMKLGMAPVFHTHKQVHELCQRAAAYGAEQREKELMAVGMEPVATLHDDGYWTPAKTEAGRKLNDSLSRAGTRTGVHTAAQLAAAQLQGAKEERENIASMTQGVSQQLVDDLERVNQGLLDASKGAATSLETISRLAGKTHYVGDDGERIETFMGHHDEVRGYAASRAAAARAAIAAASQEKSNG